MSLDHFRSQVPSIFIRYFDSLLFESFFVRQRLAEEKNERSVFMQIRSLIQGGDGKKGGLLCAIHYSVAGGRERVLMVFEQHNAATINPLRPLGDALTPAQNEEDFRWEAPNVCPQCLRKCGFIPL